MSAHAAGSSSLVRCEVAVPPGGALSDLRHCVGSVLRFTEEGHRLLLCDDGTDSRISEFAAEVARAHAHVHHLTAATETLVRDHEPPEFLVLLHPDTVVTPDWLERMIACADSDPQIGAVTSLSSSADGEMVGMLPGFTLFQMADLIASRSERRYPDVVVEGSSCLLLRTQALAELDRGGGAGELAPGAEPSLCAQLQAAGWRVVCADDTYVYRARGSYGRRPRDRTPLDYLRWLVLAAANPTWFPADEPPPAPTDDGDARQAAHRAWRPLAATRPAPLSVAFLLPVLEPFGGVLSVVNIANELILSGVDVKILTMSIYNRFADHRLYAGPIAYQVRAEIAHLFPAVDIAVATQWETVEHIVRLRELQPEVEVFYFVQGYETVLLPEEDQEGRRRVEETYRQIRRKVVKTEYLRERVATIDPVVFKITPGMDLDSFYPRATQAEPDRPRRVLCMARPSTPYRGFDTMCRVFSLVHQACPEAEFVLYGTDDLTQYADALRFPYVNRGRLAPTELPDLYSACAIYTDFSYAHGFGRTGVEAMACGAACVLTESGGVSEYAINEWNALLRQTDDIEGLAQAIIRLLRDPELQAYLSRNGLATVSGYHDREAAAQFHRLFVRARGNEI